MHHHLIDPAKSLQLDSMNVMYFVIMIFIGNVVKDSSFCFHTIIEFGSLKKRKSRLSHIFYAQFLQCTFAAIECGMSLMVSGYSRFGVK